MRTTVMNLLRRNGARMYPALSSVQVDGNTGYVALTQGQVAIFDAKFAKAVAAFNWWYHNDGYATRNPSRLLRDEGKKVYLHRFVMRASDDQLVDHVSGDRLDCRHSNLRFATDSGNSSNSRLRRGATGYKGVQPIPNSTRWQARIMFAKGGRHIGVFATAREAAEAYDREAVKHFGAFARTNAMIHGWK